MKKLKIHKLIVALTLLTALFSSCEDEFRDATITFNASIEQLSSDSKVMLVGEKWTYWEIGDSVSMGSDLTSGGKYSGELVRQAGSADFEQYNGVFLTTLPAESRYFLGLHPYSPKNNIVGRAGSSLFRCTMFLSDEQPVREDNDMTYAKQVFPMVAWYGGSWGGTPFNLDFHSLGCIVRLQLFNNTGTDDRVSKVEITSLDDKNLSGYFTVNNYQTDDPSLSYSSGGGKTLTLRAANSHDMLNFDDQTLLTFYVVLPALKGRDASTRYDLEVKVYNSEDKFCSKKMSVPVRRNGITYQRALGIEAWDGSSASPALVGNGTQERPFKIYTKEDLILLRKGYNSAERTINNQPITENTYVRIMRSDIVLSTSDWGEGIENFVGHMSYVASSTSTPGITNNGQAPLFRTIGNRGVVEGLTVRCSEKHVRLQNNFSPLCDENNGTIRNCRLYTGSHDYILYQASRTTGFGGLCVTNNGTIEGCGCVARIQCPQGSVAGICLNNRGTVRGCYASSPMEVIAAGKGAAGIVYNNYGLVEDCYFAARITSVTAFDWAGIVYSNTGNIRHCYIGETSTISTKKSVGGIVNTQSNGTINYCRCEATLHGATLGGIAATQKGGTIINCYINNPLTIFSLAEGRANDVSNAAGGLVGQLAGGTLANSFVYMGGVHKQGTNGIKGGIVGYGSGGAVHNCYAYETTTSSHHFVGKNTRTTYAGCYLVAGTQLIMPTGISNIIPSETNFNSTMLSALNLNKPANGYNWIAVTGQPPILEAE